MTFPYAVIPLGILSLYLYFFSSGLVSTGVFSRKFHRRIWNYILLITFLISALSGLFIALQINYKWEISWIDPFLKWHVDFGIALSFTGFFHFLWHWNYYFRHTTKKSRQTSVDLTKDGVPIPAVNLFHLGFVTMVTQVIFIRAGLNLFDGNELVTAMIIGLWMVFTGLGALAGSSRPAIIRKDAAGRSGLLFTGILPVLMLIAIYLTKMFFFPYGTSTGILNTLLISSLILLPFCFFSGMYFTVYAVRYQAKNVDFAGSAYFRESLGSLAGGFFTGFISVFLLSLFQTSLIVLLFTFLIIIFAYRLNSLQKTLVIFAGIIVTVLLFSGLDKSLEGMMYRGQKVLKTTQTPYGRIVMTETSGQINLFENNILLFSGQDIIHTEETIHFPLSQTVHTDTLLLISGGYKGMLKEMLKYHPARIDYTETDPKLIKLIREFADSSFAPSYKRIHYITRTDGISYLKNSPSFYDAVIIDSYAPLTLSMNRYFSLDFIHMVKEHLHPHGILSLSLPTGYNYSDENARELNSVVFNTLKKIFKNVLVLQGQQNYFLASDKALLTDIPYLIEKKGIKTTYVNSYYLNANDLEMRSSMLENEMDPHSGINTIIRPKAFFLALGYWAGMYGQGLRPIITVIGLIFIVMLILHAGRPLMFNLFLAGFTSAGLEILLLFGLQSVSGNLYQYSAILLAMFMAGLATGTWLGNHHGIRSDKSSILAAGFLLIVMVLLSVSVTRMIAFPAIWINIWVNLLNFVAASATGFIFSSSSQLLVKDGKLRVAFLYSADIFGGALGAVTISLALLPLAGFGWAAGSTALFMFLSLASLVFRKI